MMPTKYASFLKRFAAFVIDTVFTALLAAFVLIPFALIVADEEVIDNLFSFGWNCGMSGVPQAMLPRIFEPWFGSFTPIPVALMVMWFLFHTVLYWLYFAVFESSPRQATPGKMMLGIFVTDIHGRRISFPRALARTLAKILSKLILWLGYVLALFTPRSQTLHDLIAGTLVLEPAYSAPQASTAPPQAAPPGGISAPQTDTVEITESPQPPAPPETESPQAADSNTGEAKPEENPTGENDSEQENK
ncbi:MAG: hypothetical protein FVQ81_15400 [Candidatus Glassbacteria bacterium]|nr:hypothetical protein [Candidatus Glassbacteria bacterium]